MRSRFLCTVCLGGANELLQPMMIRKGWPDELSDRNRQELAYLLRMLRELLPYKRAVLFGRHAGLRLRNGIGGYELLLLTREKPALEGWQLEAEIGRRYPHEFYEERNIHIETACMDEINGCGTKNWFYATVRDTGTVVYDDSQLPAFFRAESVDHAVRHKRYRKRYDYLFGAACALLDDAERMWLGGNPHVASLDLSYAGEFLLRAMEATFYGNAIRTDDLLVLFRRVRYFSYELAQTFTLEDNHKVALFRELTRMRREPCRSCEVLHLQKYRFHLSWLRRMQQLVQRSCERHLFFLKHGKPKARMEEEAAFRPVRTDFSPMPEIVSASDEPSNPDAYVGVEPATQDATSTA